jgi:hypothetical protein
MHSRLLFFPKTFTPPVLLPQNCHPEFSAPARKIVKFMGAGNAQSVVGIIFCRASGYGSLEGPSPLPQRHPQSLQGPSSRPVRVLYLPPHNTSLQHLSRIVVPRLTSRVGHMTSLTVLPGSTAPRTMCATGSVLRQMNTKVPIFEFQ